LRLTRLRLRIMAGTGHRSLADLHSERDQTINPTRSHPTTWPNAVGGVPGAHSQKFISRGYFNNVGSSIPLLGLTTIDYST